MTTHYSSRIGVLLVTLACGPAPAPVVRPGIEVLLADSIHLVAGRRVGLLANHAGVDARGVEDLTLLRDAGMTVTALFSPEHGWRGLLDTENIGGGLDSATGIPVHSLYGDIREPTPAMLESVDVILVDLPDVGARTYTYVSTALRTLRAAGTHGVTVVVLDRPNPIGGMLVQGPLLDTRYASFVGMLPVPLRHGMTLGELMRFGREVLAIPGDLRVVPAAGWHRAQWVDATGLPWIRPSPNMPDLESASHYPGFVLFEATDLSVGRGTPLAFQVIGAPWLDAPGLVTALATVPGLAVIDTIVTPEGATDRKYDHVAFPAIRLRVTDRAVYDPVRAAVIALAWLHQHHGADLRLDADRFDQLAGGPALREALESGVGPETIAETWEPALTAFRAQRSRFLLY